MKNYLLTIVLLMSAFASAQEDAWVYFNAKPNADLYFETPLLMLSQRALDRRAQQNIPLDFKDIPVGQAYITEIDAVEGIAVMATSKWLNAIHVRGSFETINSLTSFPYVSYVDFADNSLDAADRPAQARAASQKMSKDVQVTYAYGDSDNQVEMLNGHLLHQQDKTGTGKIIAVLDSGFPGVNTAAPFQRLQTMNLILGGYNFVTRNDNFYSGGGHGSMVLSTMGGYVEDALIGTAPDASYYLFVTEDITSENPVEESLWVEATERADSLGVDIINTSLGYFLYEDSAYSYTYEDMDGQTTFISRGANIANSRGMIVVVSGGNSGNSANPHISSPGDASGALTVGAVNPSGEYAAFSSTGPAFGGNIKPDVMAQGAPAVMSDPEGDIVSANGTSFSAPITAGLVACLWQALPEKSAEEIKQLIRQSANYYSNPNEEYGYGIPNFATALALGTNRYIPESDVLLYPNPVKSVLHFQLPNAAMTAQLLVYNILGQQVLTKQLTSTAPVLIEDLASGIYIYKLSTPTKQFTGRFIKD